MNNNSLVKIILRYWLQHDPIEKKLVLSPEEYFELDPEEEIELDCIPRYNHLIEYLEVEQNLKLSEVLATQIILVSQKTKMKKEVNERFWNQGKNRLIERRDFDTYLNIIYQEIILEIQTSENPPVWEVLRIGRENDILTPSYHGILQDNNDGSQTEKKIVIESLIVPEVNPDIMLTV